LAAKDGKAEMLELLIEVNQFSSAKLITYQRGANAEFAADRGMTALFAACQTGREKCVEGKRKRYSAHT
jgi:ankyrin repeat protein